jgi:hypothetical protein
MQGPKICERKPIGRLTVEQSSDACKIIVPRSAGWHEFSVFYFFIVVALALPSSFLDLLARFQSIVFIGCIPAVIGICRSTMRHVITIDRFVIDVRREVLGLCWQEDAYPLEPPNKLRFVPPGHGRRYSKPNVLAITCRGKQRCFAPSITALEAGDLLALLRTQLPMWFQE